jgi:hypothetical protein
MQNPSDGTSGAQHAVDDNEGLRDFSASTVELRRAAGYRIAADILAGYL